MRCLAAASGRRRAAAYGRHHAGAPPSSVLSSWGKERRYWWKEKDMEELTVHQSHQLVWARAHHLVYDYCVDTDRFPVQPPECASR
uniref:Xyloglucan endo-transglycosylase C-terminal domain-containing protein n=1 Tax=Oryza barthii TaxID=65489 RepID=A0A0D3HP93_9ORYZ